MSLRGLKIGFEEDLVIGITLKALTKILTCAKLVKTEISGLGRVELRDGMPIVTEALLFGQTVNGCETRLDPKAVGLYYAELLQQGYHQFDLKCWWHSHGDGETFWSGKDIRTINRALATDWLIALVVNRSGSLLGRIELYQPVRVTFDNVPIKLILPVRQEEVARLQDEVLRKVKMSSFLRRGNPPSLAMKELSSVAVDVLPESLLIRKKE